MTQVKAAELYGMPEQSIGQKINTRESIQANEFFDLLDTIGIGVLFYVKETGEILLKESENGRRVVGISEGVYYDTKKSKLLASSFLGDERNEFGPDGKAQELYIDKNGRYFMVECSNDENVKDRIVAVPNSIATAFINQYKIPGPTEEDYL